MKQATFRRLSEIVYDASGIALTPAKQALLSARTGKRVRELGLSSHEEYLRVLEQDESGEELVHLLDAMSTNVTSFFREPSHFDTVRLAVREWLAEGRSRLRMWSAACSTGEEPYSLAMTLLEAAGARDIDARILASDINTQALDSARRGIYSTDQVANIPPGLRQRYAGRVGSKEEGLWQIRQDLSHMIVFRRLNLAEPPFPLKGPLDVVLCRNVMIYFDRLVRSALMTEMHRLLRPGGLLLLGHAESSIGNATPFEIVRPSVFRRS